MYLPIPQSNNNP